ncbi:uncharacterized protein M421DRAFT_407151 [Didymella exigua CBS 183.55]|uniref:Uncharacterized protein n=1 Tax=Didymella exigua CBS 183.55 TaxID=1150837 RepID=A0A6A5R5B0_9PLEO|nr:uncharacterized protein M421DRAFT_407151 [Didymella exigua CBS 183.55]KAF1923311.1 hypothetical protein M421DRAFT_407151 [Didymella exigua CBS 183.55]
MDERTPSASSGARGGGVPPGDRAPPATTNIPELGQVMPSLSSSVIAVDLGSPQSLKMGSKILRPLISVPRIHRGCHRWTPEAQGLPEGFCSGMIDPVKAAPVHYRYVPESEPTSMRSRIHVANPETIPDLRLEFEVNSGANDYTIRGQIVADRYRESCSAQSKPLFARFVLVGPEVPTGSLSELGAPL